MKGLVSFIFRNRRFLGFGVALTVLSSFGQTFFISLFNERICETFALTDGAYGTIYSLATVASGIALMQTGVLVDRIDLRGLSSALIVGLAIAAVTMALAPTVLVLGIAIFLLRQCGQGMLGHTSITSMARYFDADRGKAMAIASLGFAAGEAVLPLAAVVTMARFGWRETWFGVAAMLITVALPLVLWLLRGHGARHAAYLEQLQTQDDTETDAATSTAPSRRQWRRIDVLRDVRFYLLLPAIVAPAFIVTGFFFMQTRLIQEKEWSAAYFASCFAAFAAAQVPASLVAGPLVDRVGARRLTPWFLVPLAVGLLAIAFTDHPAAAIAFMVPAGLTAGSIGPIVGALWPDLYGVRHLGSIRALATSIMVFATASSPIIMGTAFDRGVLLATMAWVSAAGIGVAMTGALIALRTRP